MKYYRAKKFSFEWWIGVIAAGVFLLGTVPIFSPVFGHSFLAAPEWASKVKWLSIALGLACGVHGLWLVRKNVERDPKLQHPLKRLLLYIFAPFFFFWLSVSCVVVGAPIVGALVLGREVSIGYEVADPEARNSRRCARPIEVSGLPFHLNKICGAPDELRESLAQGSHVKVAGHGTWMGVFVKSVRKLN